MKTKFTINCIVIIFVMLAGSISFYSCNNPVALGTRLNLDPPVVTIDKPDFMDNIKDTLEIAGTAKDQDEIVFLFITVERISKTGDEWKQEWRGERGSWRNRSSADSAWQITDGIWLIEGGKGNVNWSISMSMAGAPNGEYLITVGAENNVKNTGSLEQRRVVIDTDPPAVTVFTPVLEFVNDDDNYFVDVEPAFDLYRLQDPAILDKLHNKRITIQYEIKDDFSLDKLVFQLADNVGSIYYNKDMIPVSDLNWSGKTEILAKDVIDADGSLAANGKLYLQLISIATDKAGNAKIYSHGWLVWWPDADKPWTAGVGDADDPQNFLVYPGTDVQGQAYDNDGVKQVSYQIFKKSAAGIFDDALSPSPVVLANPPLVEDAAPSTFFAWNFAAPADCSEYMIRIGCQDMYGMLGDTVERYFYVVDTSAPNITVTGPDPTASLFGDSGGNFTIMGVAEDGVDPQRVTLVWLSPGGDRESRILYRSTDYEGWAVTAQIPSGSDSSGTDFWDDATGNRLWELTLGDAAWDENVKRMSRPFAKQLNLFADLNIGAGNNQLIAQSFILRVEGANQRALTVLHSVRGDVSPPVITVEKITVERQGEAPREYDVAGLKASNESIPALALGDAITISGTWDDDSFARWNDTAKMGALTVSWNDAELSPAVLQAFPLVWAAGPLIMDDDAEIGRGGGFIVASLGDLGGNVTESIVSVKVDTKVPQLMHITSDLPNGSYKAGTHIEIYLEFNKDVEYKGSDTPSMTLSNGGTAVWDSSRNGFDKHHFTYVVEDTHDTAGARLNVAGITFTGTWEGSGGLAMVRIPNNRNLQDLKNIRIDTAAPAIAKIESLSGTDGNNYYKEGATLYLRVEFNEDIEYTSGASLGLNIMYNASGVSNGAGGGIFNVTNPAMSGSKALLFTYTVAAGHNTPFTTEGYSNRLIASFTVNTGAAITDLAGNPLTNFTIPINIGPAKAIYIDTTPPAAPVLTIRDPANAPLTSGSSSSPPVSVTVTGGETDAVLEYSVKNGESGSWLAYNSEVLLQSATTYTITARQTDKAGNPSPKTDTKTVTIIPKEKLLQSFGGSPTNTYGAGQTIVIRLNLSAEVTVTGSPKLKLNNGRDADFVTGSNNTKNLEFSFVVANGDDTPDNDCLKIDEIDLNGATLTKGSIPVVPDVDLPLKPFNISSYPAGWEQGLEAFTEITINTTLPLFEGADDFNAVNSELTLHFNKPVDKGKGNITITFDDPTEYRAPAVLTKSEYTRYGGAALSTWYEMGTNGTDADGKPDTSEKYILRYTFNTNDTANNAPPGPGTGLLIAALKSRSADTITIPVVSSVVTASGPTLRIKLLPGSAYALPVKGVNYRITFSEGLVRDNMGHEVAECLAANNKTFLNPGVNTPVIRVQKNRGSITTGTIKLPGTTVNEELWIENANVSISGQPADKDWVPVAWHYIQNPKYYEGVGTPDTDKYFSVPVPVPYWVSENVEIYVGDNAPNDGNEWAKVEPYYMHPPFESTVIVPAPADISKYASETIPADRGWVKIADVAQDDPGEAGWIYTANGNFWRKEGIWYNVDPGGPYDNPPGINQGWNANAYVKVDNTASIQMDGNRPDDQYIKLSSAFTFYARFGTGIWRNEEYHNEGGQNLKGFLTSLYWVKKNLSDTVNWTKDDKENTPGWVPVESGEFEDRWIELGKGTWRNPGWTDGTFIPTPAYFVERGEGTGWDGSLGQAVDRIQVSLPPTYTPGGDSDPTAVATQPYTAKFKIDCQTPGATIQYTSDATLSTPIRGGEAGANTFDGNHPRPTFPAAQLATLDKTYNGTEDTLGTTANLNGYLYGIRARASKTIGGSPYTSADSYEMAARSVIHFQRDATPNNWNNLTTQANTGGKQLQLWIRGGDGLSGANLTPGFPLTWDEKDLSGARLFTQDTGVFNWYWITWEVTTQAYFHFIAGTTTTVAEAANGPHDWSWGKNLWAFQQIKYPLYPGASLEFSQATTVTDPATDQFEFYDHFNTSR